LGEVTIVIRLVVSTTFTSEVTIGIPLVVSTDFVKVEVTLALELKIFLILSIRFTVPTIILPSESCVSPTGSVIVTFGIVAFGSPA
jgi:hypothetical protein